MMGKIKREREGGEAKFQVQNVYLCQFLAALSTSPSPPQEPCCNA